MANGSAGNTWTIDPGESWLSQNSMWLHDKAPAATRCGAALTGYQCELTNNHTCAHMTRALSKDGTPKK